MKLISLPDCKKFHSLLTVGKEYKILDNLGNGYVIETDNSEDRIIILKERFEA